jgi:hypothetical protein
MHGGSSEEEATILDGSYPGDESLASVRQRVVTELAKRNWQANAIVLRDLDIRNCLDCFGCWTKLPGTCTINDAGRDIARTVSSSDSVGMLALQAVAQNLREQRMIAIPSPLRIERVQVSALNGNVEWEFESIAVLNGKRKAVRQATVRFKLTSLLEEQTLLSLRVRFRSRGETHTFDVKLPIVMRKMVEQKSTNVFDD